jgi:hypothetical protein
VVAFLEKKGAGSLRAGKFARPDETNLSKTQISFFLEQCVERYLRARIEVGKFNPRLLSRF